VSATAARPRASRLLVSRLLVSRLLVSRLLVSRLLVSSATASRLRGVVHDDERLDAAAPLGREEAVPLLDVLERDPVRDDLARREVPVAHVLEQPGPLSLSQ